jgi:prevent-host-death family protein
MAKEKVMPFVQARSKLSEIIDRVAESGDTYVVSKRQKPVAVIIGIEKYRELSGTSKYLKNVGGKRIMNLEGIATAVGDIDEAIRELRKSRIEAVSKKFS